MVVFICWRILNVGEILNLLVSFWANFLQVCLQRCLFPSPGIPDHQRNTARNSHVPPTSDILNGPTLHSSDLIQPQRGRQMVSGVGRKSGRATTQRETWAAWFPHTALPGLPGTSSDPPGLRLKWERLSLSVPLSKCHLSPPTAAIPALTRTHRAAAVVLQVVVPAIIALHLPADVLGS